MHRDIKPQNFLMTHDKTIKLCDFGYARTMPSECLKVPRHKSDLASSLQESRMERSSKERALSPHIVTRWYRPPEVILLERAYNDSIDIWSSACVISELLTCSKEYRAVGFLKEKRQMFRGKSCYPLSPVDSSNQDIVGKRD